MECFLSEGVTTITNEDKIVESIDIVIDKFKHAKELLKRQMLNLDNDEYDYGHDINNKNYGTDY